MTQDDFDRLLQWLDPDREKAGHKYEEIRRKLTRFFICRGCPEAQAEDLVDETINRVARKLPEIIESYVGERMPYFIRVAHFVYLEFIKPRPVLPTPPPEPVREEDYDCLEECLGKLSEEDRKLILQYYAQEKQEKIDLRRQMAETLGIAPNALRIRLHRIRAKLLLCVIDCIEQAATA